MDINLHNKGNEPDIFCNCWQTKVCCSAKIAIMGYHMRSLLQDELYQVHGAHVDDSLAYKGLGLAAGMGAVFGGIIGTTMVGVQQGLIPGFLLGGMGGAILAAFAVAPYVNQAIYQSYYPTQGPFFGMSFYRPLYFL